MFQPKPINLNPKLIQAKVPVWLVAAIITVDIVVVQVGQQQDPSCAIKFEKIHYSTSNFRNLGKDSIKLNLKTTCTAAQKYSEITASISTLKNGKSHQVYTSTKTRENANIRNSSEAEFLEFWVTCEKNSIKKYKGFAHGKVTLLNGTTISVSDDTGEYLSVLCNFKAK